MDIPLGSQHAAISDQGTAAAPNMVPCGSPGPALPTTFASSWASTELAWRKSLAFPVGLIPLIPLKLSAVDESMFNRRNKEEIWTNKKYDQITSASEHAVHPWSAIIWGGRGQKKTSRNQKTRTLGHRFLSTFLCFFNGKGTWLAGCFCCARSSAANGLKVSHTNAGKIQPVIDRPLEQSSSKPFKSGCLT